MGRLDERIREESRRSQALDELQLEREQVRETLAAIREAESRRIKEGFASVLFEIEVYHFQEAVVERMAEQFAASAPDFRRECANLLEQGEGRRSRHRLQVPIHPHSEAPIALKLSGKDFQFASPYPDPEPSRLDSTSERRAPRHLRRVGDDEGLPEDFPRRVPAEPFEDLTGLFLSVSLRREAQGELKGLFRFRLSRGSGWDVPRTEASFSSESNIDGDRPFLLGTSMFQTEAPVLDPSKGQAAPDRAGEAIVVFGRCRH